MEASQMFLASGGNLFTWDNPKVNEVKGSNNLTLPVSTSVSTSKQFAETKVGGFLNMLLSNGGNIAQIIGAFNGNQPTITDGKGKTHDLSIVKSEIEKISAQKNQDKNTVLQMMMMQLQNEKNKRVDPPVKKNNKTLYIALGVGALVLVGGALVYQSNKKK